MGLGPFDPIFTRLFDYIIAPLVTLFFGAATIIFIWGLIQYLWKSDNADARATGRVHMMWGIFGLFIMFVAVGILRIICNFFGEPCFTILPF